MGVRGISTIIYILVELVQGFPRIQLIGGRKLGGCGNEIANEDILPLKKEVYIQLGKNKSLC